MKNPLRGAIIASIALGSLGACNLDYFDVDKFAGGSYRPTLAVPLVEVNLTVADILKSYENNILLSPDQDDTSRKFLTLVFSDTLDPISLNSYALAGIVPQGTTIPLPIEKVDLRIFGNLQDGSFTLTDPSVIFNLDNSTAATFDLEFRDGLNGEFYTQKVNDVQKNYLEVTDALHPYPISANDLYDFTLNNDNLLYPNSPTELAMTRVINPTPKFLYYGVDLTTTNTTTNLDGKVGVVASVFLPLKGYANTGRKDTIAYEFISTDTGGAELNFAEIRLIITNGLPISGEIFSAEIIDTTTTPWTKMMNLQLNEEDGTINTAGILIDGATGGSEANNWEYTPTEKLNDIILTNSKEVIDLVQPVEYGTNTPVGLPMSKIEALGEGNKIVLEFNLKTSKINADPKTVVKMYSAQTMNIKVGVRVQASLDLGAVTN
jgi:hypothetical protein